MSTLTEVLLDFARVTLDFLLAKGLSVDNLHQLVDETAVKRANEAQRAADDLKFGKAR